MAKIIITLINYNGNEDTTHCLRSLEQIDKDDHDLEVVVVDNASRDPYTADPDAYQNFRLRIIKSEVNLGFTGGNNIGFAYGIDHNADYIMILNNDTTVHKEFLVKLLTVAESDNKIGIVSPKIYFAKGHEFHKERYKKEELGKVFWFAGGNFDWPNIRSVHRGVDEVDHGQYDKEESIDFTTGCCMLIKREVLQKIGLFDDKYFLYYEDADLCCRVKKAGYSIYYAPQSVVMHINAGSSGGAGNVLQDYFITRNQMLFGMRYAPLRVKAALLRQSLKLLKKGRPNQRKGIKDYYLHKFGKGTFF